MQAGLKPMIAAPVGVIILLKVPSPRIIRLSPRVPRETLDLGLLGSDDDGTLDVVFPLGGIVWNT